eukprot:3849523-Pleurochrysis_carterae.AAC.1
MYCFPSYYSYMSNTPRPTPLPFRRGNLWKYATAKLEARGARCKHIVRRQTSARPRMKEGKGGFGTGRVRAVIAKRGGSEKQKRMGVVVT